MDATADIARIHHGLSVEMHFHGMAFGLLPRALRGFDDLIDDLVEGVPVIVEKDALGRKRVGYDVIDDEFGRFNAVAAHKRVRCRCRFVEKNFGRK